MPPFYEVPPPPLPGDSGVRGPLIWQIDRRTIFKDQYLNGAGGYWPRLRAEALARDGGQCCDRKLGQCSSGTLQCHHVEYPATLPNAHSQLDWLADRPENVVMLCRHHHEARHPVEVEYAKSEKLKEIEHYRRLGWNPWGVIDEAMLQRLLTPR